MTDMFSGEWRLFFHSPVSIRQQMAMDEALLKGIRKGGPALCFYRIWPATISLGQFQKLAEAFIPAKFQEYAATFVRRPTGGQALLHKEALVFSLIIGREHFEPFRKKEIYLAFAPIFIQALKALGIPACINLKKNGVAKAAAFPPGLDLHPHCFESAGDYEVMTTMGKKLVGSAQLITREGCLQQNFIPLDSSYRELVKYLYAGREPVSAGREPASAGREPASADSPPDPDPESTSLTEAAGRLINFEQAQSALLAGFQEFYRLRESIFNEEERERIQTLLDEKYNHPSWNNKY
jgi:lipoate-protein ligase A